MDGSVLLTNRLDIIVDFIASVLDSIYHDRNISDCDKLYCILFVVHTLSLSYPEMTFFWVNSSPWHWNCFCSTVFFCGRSIKRSPLCAKK